jgi:hypothetical protein
MAFSFAPCGCGCSGGVSGNDDDIWLQQHRGILHGWWLCKFAIEKNGETNLIRVLRNENCFASGIYRGQGIELPPGWTLGQCDGQGAFFPDGARQVGSNIDISGYFNPLASLAYAVGVLAGTINGQDIFFGVKSSVSLAARAEIIIKDARQDTEEGIWRFHISGDSFQELKFPDGSQNPIFVPISGGGGFQFKPIHLFLPIAFPPHYGKGNLIPNTEVTFRGWFSVPESFVQFPG